MTGFLYRLGRRSAERGWKVIGIWLLVAFVLMGANRVFGGDSADSFILKGTDSSVAQDLLNRAFPGSSAEATPIVLFDPDSDLAGAGAQAVDDIAEQLRPYNLTHAGFGVLAIAHREPAAQRDLAHATRVEEQTMSQTVDRLERMGMVTRERDPSDRRRFLITVTDVGLQAFRHATRHDRAEQAMAGLEQAENLREALAELIRRLGGTGYVPS